jgi:hemolysin activation/secretion protein
VVVLLGMTFSVAAQQAGDPAAQELLRQQERERVLREQQEQRPDVRLERMRRRTASTCRRGAALRASTASCWKATTASARLGTGGGRPGGRSGHGRCLGTEGINVVMKRVQNAIIARGYVTTRVLSAPQDLNRAR